MYICKVINKVAEKRLVPKDSQGATGLSFEEYQRVANEVNSGLWGGGNVRRTRLEEAGYVYEAVQTIVNHMYSPYPPIDMSYFNQNGNRSLSLVASSNSEPTEAPVLRAAGDSYPTNLDIDIYQEIANQVLRGVWGYMPERQERLEAAGYYFPAVQTIVNHMLPPYPDIDMKYFTPTSDDPSIDPDSGESGGSDTPEPTPAPAPTPEPYNPDDYKEITVNVYKEHIFHYPPANDRNMVVLSGKISNEINRAGTFEFQLPPSNYCLKNKLFKKLTSIIEVYWGNDAEPYFRGRILDSQKAFNGTMTFRCEGMMSVLNDSVVRPLGDSEKGIDAPVGNLFHDLITFHNNQVYDAEDPDSPKYFKTIDIQGYDDTEFNFPYANYEKTLEYIQNNILSNEEVGGRMWVDGQTIHLHADTEALQTISEQPIVFGENLFDLTQSVNASELYTVILPTGKDGLTIKSETNGVIDYIENSAAVSKFGRIWYHAEFSDVDSPSTLVTKATEMLNRNIDEVTSIEVSALDMHIMNSDQKPLKIGTYIPVMSPPHGIDVSYICTAASIDICNPANTKYTLGVNPETLTTKQMKLSNNIAQTALQYKSEASTYNIDLNVVSNRVTVSNHSFYRSGSVVYLSFTASFNTSVNADSGMVIFTYDAYNNPASPVTANGYNQTTNKSCLIRSNNGQISIESSTPISRNNVVTCTMTWTRR